MDAIRQETEVWLEMAASWQQTPHTLATIKQQSHDLPRILVFLEALTVKLKSCTSISEMLHEIPAVGQLLGRLTLYPRLLLDNQVYTALINAILCFYINQPTSPMERRSKTWVLNQVRQMMVGVGSNPGPHLVTNTGHTLTDVHHMCAQQIMASIEVMNNDACDTSTLCDICVVCLSLRHIAIFDRMLVILLRKLVLRDGTHPMVVHLFNILHDTNAQHKSQNAADSRVPVLSYPLQVLLWTYSITSLEEEIYSLTDTVLQSPLAMVDQLITSTHLIEACRSEPVIYTAVMSILRQLLHDCMAHWKLVWLLYRLYVAINSNHSNQKTLTLTDMSHLQPLVNLLEINSSDLPLDGVEHHIKLIDLCLSEYTRTASAETDLLIIFVYHLHWYHAALCYSFTCHRKVLPCCLRLLLTVDKSDDSSSTVSCTIEVLEDILESLRYLYSKQALTPTDINYALSSVMNNEGGDKVLINKLLCKLMLVFCMLAVGGHRVIPNVLSMVCGRSSTSENHAEVLLETVTFVKSNSLPRARITRDAKDYVISAVKHSSEKQQHSVPNYDKQLKLLFKEF